MTDRRFFFWKSTNYNEVCEFLFRDLLDIIDFDLKNVIFTVGVHIRQQNVEAPIGGILSAVYAILTCALAEHNWVCSIGTDLHFLSSVRYVDDGIVAIAYSTTKPLFYACSSLTKKPSDNLLS